MKQRAYEKALAARRAKIDDAKALSQAKLLSALSVDEIKCAYDDYVKATFTATDQEAESVQNARSNYISALKKYGFCQNDFEYIPVCAKCGDSGEADGKPCSCIWDEYIKCLRAVCDIERRAPFTFEMCDLTLVKDASQRAALETLYARLSDYADRLPYGVNACNITLVGGVGTGKTCLASAVARRAVDGGKDCMFLTAYEFNARMLKTHLSPIDGRDAMLADVLEADLLVIDDLGTEPMLNNVTSEYLLLVLEERTAKRLCTLFTSNLDAERILHRYGERIYSRLSDKRRSRIMALEGKDLRL